MKIKSLLTVLVLIVLSFSAFVAYSGLHFVGNTGFGSGSVIINVAVAGISNQTNAVVVANVSGTGLTAMCQNRGENFAPGQNPVNVNVTASDSDRSDRNGRAEFSFTIDLISQSGLSKQSAGCPNGNWTITGLIGTVHVNLQAFVEGQSTPADTLNYTCTVNEANTFIQCTEV